MGSRLGLMIAGLCCLLSGYRLFLTPLPPDAPEMHGWVFQQFGQHGVAIGAAALGMVMLGFDAILVMRTIRRTLRQRMIRNGSS